MASVDDYATGIEENLVGRITRSVLFSDGAGNQLRQPADTEVYVTNSHRPGCYLIRLPGTLLTQTVYIATVEPI
jgi:hypothetical protein